MAKQELENQIEALVTEEINLNDEDLNLPNHRFTQQALDLDKQNSNLYQSSIISTENTNVSVNLELFQEKQDEIERLQDLLDKQKTQLADTLKLVADLNENLQIAEERTSNAIKDKEKFADKNREYIHKIQGLKDQNQDQVILIEEKDSKLQLIMGENQMLRDSQ